MLLKASLELMYSKQSILKLRKNPAVMNSDYYQADKLVTHTDFGEFNGFWQTNQTLFVWGCHWLEQVSGYLTQTRVTPEAVLSYKQQLIYDQSPVSAMEKKVSSIILRPFYISF